MSEDNIDKRNGAYDAVAPLGQEPYLRRDASGHPVEVRENPVPLRLERGARPPLNPRTGRRPAD